METDFPARGNHVLSFLQTFLPYLFHCEQLFHLVEIYFKRILYYDQRQQIFCLLETIIFHSCIFYFFETIIIIRRRPIFLKELLFLLAETVFFNFFRTIIQMEAVFRSTEILTVSQFLKKSIIPVIWNHFFGFAGIPVSKSIFFQLVETVFSSNPSLRLVYRGFGFKQCAFIQCLFSLLVMNKIFHVLKFLEFINELWKICFPLGKNV